MLSCTLLGSVSEPLDRQGKQQLCSLSTDRVLCSWSPFPDPTHHPCVAIHKPRPSQGGINFIFLHTPKWKRLHLIESPSAPIFTHRREMATAKAIPQTILGACLRISQMMYCASKIK